MQTRSIVSAPLGAFTAVTALLLAACSSNSEPPPVAAGKEHIACAVGGAAELKPVCSVERAEAGGRLTLVVHHPDGAFRRFDVTTDGSGLAVSDGAEKAQTRLVDGKLDVTVGPDRYLFPATEKSHGAK
ncbi:hypothetical protein GR702_10550 [Novosphingobium sp. FGD1]|jgi:hypothetical protein|uniref:Lipoprotein n=1 Tax=Novosphingobium silvae TaxID=2692619 RepID=A0A7X4GI63_9SPHN|nr:hypothetical protein [Novosphingobium silvae]MYL98207.1 hypothetical protein [Novosphingobium silvae]